MTAAFSYIDKSDGEQRNFELDDSRYVVAFRGRHEGLLGSAAEFLESVVSPFDELETALDEIRKDKSTWITGINEIRGFARVTMSANPDDSSDKIKVKDNLIRLKKNRSVIDFAEALIEKHSGNDNRVYRIPGTFILQLTKEYLEKPRIDSFKDNDEKFLNDNDLQTIGHFWTPGLHHCRIPKDMDILNCIAHFNDMEEVAFVLPTHVVFEGKSAIYPNETILSSDIWGVKKIRAIAPGTPAPPPPNAWNHAKMGPNGSNGVPEVIVAVIDTGVINNHQDLGSYSPSGGTNGSLLRKPSWSEDWDFSDKLSKDPIDTDGHGTQIAGIIGAKSPNTPVPYYNSAVGVAPGCKIMPLKVNISVNLGGLYADAADAINYVGSSTQFTDFWGTTRGPGQAVSNPGNRYIINLSWTMDFDSAEVRTAIQTANNNNVLIIAAAGDTLPSGIDIGKWTSVSSPGNVWPAAYPQVLPVAATQSNDTLTATSNKGSGTENNKVVCAPGSMIYTTGNAGTADYDSNLNGTSYAAAFVSGVAALTYTAAYKRPGGIGTFGKTQCRNIITGNPAPPAWNPSGFGKVDAWNCVNAVT
jgi:hypothetical protein